MTPTSPQPGRQGPSCGLEHELLPGLLNYTIRHFFPEIWMAHNGDGLTRPTATDGAAVPPQTAAVEPALQAATVALQEMYLDFFKEVKAVI